MQEEIWAKDLQKKLNRNSGEEKEKKSRLESLLILSKKAGQICGRVVAVLLAATVGAAQPHTAVSPWASLEMDFSGLSASPLNPSSSLCIDQVNITWVSELWVHQWIQPSMKLFY